jgi:hypothetical protein
LPVSLLLLDREQDAECFVLLKLVGFESSGVGPPRVLFATAAKAGQNVGQPTVDFSTTQCLGLRVKLNEQSFNL